ncbi:response regulator [Massilia sp. B-10]|nr:response regulator [Massilia sp. B-10]
MNELDGLSALIIEPHAGMRASVRSMLNLCGLAKIEDAPGSNAAVKLVTTRSFDLILCEYDLDGGQDGQQLLEDMRHHKLISISTMFFMVTAEGNFGKVISAAELTPTDYILKPFTADRLLERIGRALDKRNAFMQAHQLMELGNQADAIAACIEGVKLHPRYAIDFLRLRAELHMVLGEAAEAEAIYQQLFEARQIGWARLGMARTLFMRERFEEARDARSADRSEQEIRRRLRLAGAHPGRHGRTGPVADRAGRSRGRVAARGAAPAAGWARWRSRRATPTPPKKCSSKW